MSQSITLYHASWCPHCVNFMPIWNELKPQLAKIGVKYAEYESDANAVEVDKANIRSFPTIKINKGNKVYDYAGPRTVDAIMAEFSGQRGGKLNKVYGNDDEYYKIKYLKYKAKYFKLKDTLERNGRI